MMPTMKRTPAVIVAVLTVLLAGCGGGTPSATGPTTTTALTATAAAQPSSAPAQSPGSIITKLQAAHLPVVPTVTYTAESDPNHLLGRPGKYSAKASWTDTRVDPSRVRDTMPGNVDLGGSVEQFGSAADAQARMEYIVSVEKALPFAEYDYVSGSALVRVSSALTPDQAKAYQAALGL